MSEKEILKFDAEVEKIFKLVIHSIYENKEIFLRELISNASDACDKLRYQSSIKEGLIGDDKELKIIITADKKAKTLTIYDNGIGMSRTDIIKNLGTIARSGTQNFLEKLSGENKKDTQLIGQFGVGFYSSFMVADKVVVISKAAGGKKAHRWESTGTGEYSIEEIKGDVARGTSVTLHLKEEDGEYLDQHRVKHVVKSHSNHIAFPIIFIGEEGEEESINDGKALWLKPRSEISQDDYDEFYKDVSFLGGDKPFLTIHNRVEGKIEYTNLLFIPSTKPFDLFHPDRLCRVKLYVKRVFIAEEGIDIIPPYLRFLRGVVDSEDLPLNISRETVQNSAVIQRMKTSITNRVLRDLAKKSESDSEGFLEFWNNFGSVIKEGLCDGFAPRDDLLEVCRFKSTKSGDKLITMKEYVSNMKSDQKEIYFITGEEGKILASPQLEGFEKRGVEVLLLTDSVDEFWVNVLHEYEDISLKSITRKSADFDKNQEDEENSSGENSDSAPKEDVKITQLISFIKETLGESVKGVNATQKLTSSPVCLAVPDRAMDIRMERFMVENKQMASVSAKIFEINPEHIIIKNLAEDLNSEKDKTKISDTIHLLFDQANIVEGEPVSDLADFTRRMNEVISKALAA